MNNENYTQSVLKKVVNKYLEQKIPASDIGLNSLIEEADHIVWEIATYIYKESGHQLDFSLIRSLIDVRIKYLKGLFTEEKRLEEERRIAEEKRLVEERRIAEEKILAEIRKAQIQRITQELVESGKESSLIPTFVKIIEIISNQLNISLESINLNLDIIVDNDCYSNVLVAIEEKINIPIPNCLEDLRFPCSINELLNYLVPNILTWKKCAQQLESLGKNTDRLTLILVKIKNIVAEYYSRLRPDQIELKSSVKCYDPFDRMEMLQMITSLEKEFEIQIPSEEAEKFATVEDILNYLAEKVL